MQWQVTDTPSHQLHATFERACTVKDSTQLEPLAHSPDRAAQRIGISTRAIYSAIATGELRSFKIGKRRLITETELQSLVQRKMAQAVL